MQKLMKCIKCKLFSITINHNNSICRSCLEDAKEPVNDMHPIFAYINRSHGMMK